MAEEPQPPTVTEGADAPTSLPATAEDRKAAAAMSSLDERGSAADASAAASAGKKEVDVKALTDAMKMLEAAGGSGGKGKKDVKKEEAKKVLVKVDAADVALLVDVLDVTKVKAMELLRAHEADAGKAMTAWVTAGV